MARPETLLVALALLLPGETVRADWRDPIAGAPAILPTQFTTDEVLTVHPMVRWSLPLVDRRLSASERGENLAPTLIQAIARIEPIYDATRLDEPVDVSPLRVDGGTAQTRDVFGDRWRVASDDPNVDLAVRPLARGWFAGAQPLPCDAFRVRRRHDWGEAALTAPGAADCRALAAGQARGFTDAPLLAIAIAAPPVPIFAAPEPGSRMSSQDFWAAQKARIEAIRSHLHRKWQVPRTASAAAPDRS